MKHRFEMFFLLVSLAALLVCLPLASAQSAGYDLLQTGTGTSVNLSTAQNPSCGSWPNLGAVTLNGRSFDGTIGNTDTVMNRTATSQSNVFNVSVYALSLKSANTVSFKGQNADVYVTINNSGGTISQSQIPHYGTTSSSGTITINGGTFDSDIIINAEVIIVKAGQDPSNSANVICHAGAPGTELKGTASSWTSTPPSGYPSSTKYPSGGFYPRPVHSAPTHLHAVVPATCGGVQPASKTSSGSVPQPAIAKCIAAAQ
jgi:hypothetical protein